MAQAGDTLWYFGYGSNTERETFLGRRRMRPIEVLAGRLDDFELRFDLPIGKGERGPIAQRLQEAFFDVVAGRNQDYAHWLTHL